jgi:hypothetical protein
VIENELIYEQGRSGRMNVTFHSPPIHKASKLAMGASTEKILVQKMVM